MSPPNYYPIHKGDEIYEKGLEGRTDGPNIGEDSKLADKFSELNLHSATQIIKKPSKEAEIEVGRIEEAMYFVIDGLNYNDLYNFAQTSTSKLEKNLVKKVSAVERKSNNGKLVQVNKKDIAIFRFGKKVFAIDEKCPHVGGPLHLGDIETIGEGNILCVVCPWHRWKIELATGKLKHPQKQKQTHVYPVRISTDGALSIGFYEFSPDYFTCNEDF